jgi:hypothetical protein
MKPTGEVRHVLVGRAVVDLGSRPHRIRRRRGRAYVTLSAKPWSRRLGVGFNILGLTDLLVAVSAGVMSAPGVFRQIVSVPSAELMTTLPMVLAPIFLVPLYVVIHLFSLRQLLGASRSPERAEFERTESTPALRSA